MSSSLLGSKDPDVGDDGSASVSPREKWVLVEGSFNPPTITHDELVRDLSKRFDRVVVMPVGARYDWRRRAAMDSVMPSPHRAALVDLAFRGLAKNVTVDLADLEEDDCATLLPYDRLCMQMDTLLRQVEAESSDDASTEDSIVEKRLEKPELYVACGADTLATLKTSMANNWGSVHVVVYKKPGVVIKEDVMPVLHTLLPELTTQIPSLAVREAVFSGRNFSNLVVPKVAEYIRSYMLYRGVPPPTSPALLIPRILAKIVWDGKNEFAASMAERLLPIAAPSTAEANMIICLGGDGFMLRAIRKLFRLRLPFFGINCGHLGFLLNECEASLEALLGHDGKWVPADSMVVHQLPLLSVSLWDRNGERMPTQLCFNDCWMERSSGQSAWIEVAVDGEVKLEKMVCDGALVSTAAGSTAYAHAMGVSPIPVGSPIICLVGNNVSQPPGLRPVYLPVDCTVDLTCQDRNKRPVRAFVDGVCVGKVSKMSIHASNASDCRLVFLKKLTMVRKLSMLQFPHVTEPFPKDNGTCVQPSSRSPSPPATAPSLVPAPTATDAFGFSPNSPPMHPELSSRSISPQPGLLRQLHTQQQL